MYRTATGVAGEVRGYRPGEPIRVNFGVSTVQVAVGRAAREGVAVLRFHQEWMGGVEECERRALEDITL